MPFHPRTLSFVGLACVLALLLSVSTLAPHRASAQTALLPPSTAHFIQTATSANTFSNSTYIDNIATNSQPYAVLFVTQNGTPGGICGCIFDPHPVGVWYNNFVKKWAIFNEDKAIMPLGASFNVLVVNSDGLGLVFIQTATSSNRSGNSTYIDNIFTNGSPSAQLLVTQNWNPGGIGNTYNNHHVGVWYNNFVKKWAIFNEDKANMPLNAAFSVMIGAGASGGGTAFLQTSTVSNSGVNYTLINSSLTNWDPNAIVFATHNYNPGGIGGLYDDDSLMAYYWYVLTPNQWSVGNETHLSLIGASFNILAFSS